MLHQLHCSRMYIRFFDVDWDTKNNTAMPVATVRMPQQKNTALAYVPVIFITQNALKNISDSSIHALALNIAELTQQLCSASGVYPPEIQVDCDWIGSMREKYFLLLQQLKLQPYFRNKALSCTIRMHQVKYVQQSGVPPVDKGLLMCYNMGDLKKYDTRNSILDVEEAKAYLGKLNSYPLPLDVALPLFRWCLLFREGRFKGILRDIQPEEIGSNSLFSRQQTNVYRCTRDTLYKGYFLKEGDMLRTEAPSAAALTAMAAYTANRIRNKEMNVVFFDCDSIILSKYSTDELEKVFSAYK